jgi:5-methylcytosine-specific restriction endonuclease McrA
MKARKWQGSNWIRSDKRLAIYMRDGAACVYCGRDAAVGAVLTLDHVVAHKLGGSNHQTNLVTSCRSCNSAKQHRTMEEWYGQLAKTFGQAAVRAVKERVAGRTADLRPYRRAAKNFLAGLAAGQHDNVGQTALAARRSGQ